MKKFLHSCLYAAACSLTVLFVGLFVPRGSFDPNNRFFMERPWEKKLYQKLHVSKWKSHVPDMSVYIKRLMLKKLGTKTDPEKLKGLIAESCIAEGAHFILCILGLGLMLVWEEIGGVICSFLYIIGNLPYIIIQRYNRPRFIKTLKKWQNKELTV